MLTDGIYMYFKLKDSGGKEPAGTLKIKDQNLTILSDPKFILKGMFEEGPVTRKVEDIMKSVNRNHYAVFIKDNNRPVKSTPEQVEKEIKSVYEELGKGEFTDKLKTGVAGVALAASTLMAPANTGIERQPIAQQVEQRALKVPVKKEHPEKQRILNAMMDVESSGNKNRAHDRLPQNIMHRGERAYGAYGITPVVIRETIKKHPDLMQQHGSAVKLTGSDLHNYMDKNPNLEHTIASRHYDRLAKVFGHDPSKISYAWLNGITGAKSALQQGTDLKNHWHVAKVLKAYEARKKKGSK